MPQSMVTVGQQMPQGVVTVGINRVFCYITSEKRLEVLKLEETQTFISPKAK